jgi:hypothetical protein
MRVIILLLALWGSALAGAPDTIYTKRFGGTSYDLATGGCADLSGGYVLTGGYQHPTGPQGQDVYVVRVNPLYGDTIYTRTYGGNASDQGADIHYGSFRTVIVGTTSSFGANPPNIYVVATNALGDTNWTRAFDSGGVEGALSVDRHGSGDYFIAGYKLYLGNFDGLVMKVDSTGTLVWTRVFGGSAHDQLFDVLALSDGGCVAVGETYNFGTNAPPRGNAWMIRYDSAGDTVWTRAIGDSAHDQRAAAIALAPDGGFVLAGYEDHPLGNQDFLVIRTDSNGNEIWSEVFGGASDDALLDVAVSCENVTVSGYTSSYGMGGQDGFLAELTLDGDTLWTKTMGGVNDDILYALSSGCNQWYDAGYYAAGMTENDASGPYDTWLVKLAADPQMHFTSPSICDHFTMGQTVPLSWSFQGLETFGYLSLELNRDYPIGSWEMINPSFYNTGFQNFTATLPASHNCRLRLTKLQGGSAQAISETFSIIPSGALTSPVMDWDSSWYGSVGIRDFLATADTGFVYPYGSSIIKRDSIGGVLWTASYSFGSNFVYSNGSICQLSTGNFVTIGHLDNGSPLFMTCNESGAPQSNPYSPGGGSVFVDIAATDSGGLWLLSSHTTGYYTYAYVWHSDNNDAADTVNADVSFLPEACALTEGGLMIAGDIGDVFMNDRDIFLIGVNNDYDTLWTKRIDFGENDHTERLVRFKSGIIYLLGNQIEALGGTWRGFIAALDDSGNVLEQWLYEDREEAQLWGIAEDIDGRILASGSSKFIAQASDAVLVKFDCSGQMDWEVNHGGENSEHFYAVSAMSGGGYLGCGDRYFPSGGGFGSDRPTAVKFGPETFYTPPACPPADSLVIMKDEYSNSVTLTWVGDETGVYFIYSSSEPGEYPGGGWSLIGCYEAGPPPSRLEAPMSWTDNDLSPEKKFYVVVHDCNQGCGGGEN